MASARTAATHRGWRLISKIILRPLIHALMKHDWHGQENILPADSGMILAVNHLSYADVLALSLFTDKAGRYPVFLAKSSLFDIKVLGPVMRKLGQLPVYRGQADAALVLRDAEQGLQERRLRDLLPGGDGDPRPGPMADGGQDRRGQARAGHRRAGDPGRALGRAADPALRQRRPHVIPRSTVQVLAGPPVDLSEFEGQPLILGSAPRGHRQDHGGHHRPAGRASAARYRPPRRSTRRSRAARPGQELAQAGRATAAPR